MFLPFILADLPANLCRKDSCGRADDGLLFTDNAEAGRCTFLGSVVMPSKTGSKEEKNMGVSECLTLPEASRL
jgi:hypothetical protein